MLFVAKKLKLMECKVTKEPEVLEFCQFNLNRWSDLPARALQWQAGATQ